jgi:amino acid adenylation domain-containing protein
MWLTSALFEQWVFALNEDLSSLKYLLAGGDIVNSYAVNELHKKLPNVTIIDGYGPTENTTFTTTYQCNREKIYSDIPIGKAINNTTLYIVDRYKNLVTKGVVGELYTGGDGVARGYFNQDALTQEKFIEFRGDRVYKTGDLVKYREDGNIIYLGRSDNQVKIRGFRVELGEIEQQILQLDGVKECVVLEKNKQLIGYITEDNQKVNTEHLKNMLKEHLPEYMIPLSLTVLENMPINPNGKVDRRALSKMEVEIVSNQPFVAPKGEIEERLASIFEEVLQLKSVGLYDNFFELGGHSLLATKLVAHIRDELMVEVPLKTLFASPTITGLKEFISSTKVSNNLPKITKREQESDIPLSFAQERLWFLDKFEEGKMEAYNMPVLLKLKGELNKRALEESLETIIERHEILRTNFVEKEMIAYQVIRNHQFQIETISTTQIEIFKLVEARLLEGFDLENDLLFRTTLFDLGSGSYYLFVNMHHIVADGWSIDIFIKEFIALYQAYIEDRHHLLKPLEIQYADYALWQRDYLKDEVLEEKLNYYRDKLAGIEPLNLPTQYSRPITPSYRGDRVKFVIDNSIATELNHLSQSHKSTLFMTLLGAFALLMQRYSGQDDIVIGSPIANRVSSEVEDLIGFFVNLLPFRVRLEEGSFVSLLNQIKETTLDGYEHQDIPFEKIVEGLNIPRDTSISPIFQVLFILQNNQQRPLELSNLTLEPVEFENPTSKFDLTMELNEVAGEIEGVLEYATDLFSREFIEGMVEHFKVLLSQIVKDKNKHLSEYKIISKLETLPPKRVEFSNKTLHQIIEEQVAQTPNSTAIIFEKQTLTYQELNQKANQLAHYLIEQGVEIEDIVALKLDRSLEMIIGILGVLKAGGAYLPIDTNYPQSRIDYILENSQAKRVLSQQDIKTIIEQNSNISNPNITMSPKSLAYIIYTSGSTGNPKGVMVEHQGVVNRLEWQIKELNITSSDVILQKTPFSFDVSVWELLLPLMCGAKEVIAKPNGHKDSNYLANIIKQEQITTMHFVPSMLSVINKEPQFIENSHYLKRVVCSGEALPLNLVKEYYKLHNAPIYNLYGPTEASIDVTIYLCPQDTSNLNTIPIGKAIDNTNLYILDKHLNPVPKGVVGELYIEGVGVARGYLNNIELTKKAFIDHNGTILYKTGDLVKRLLDDNIEYIGRSDNQVKLRGLRIELGEIEQQLQNIEAIKEAIVVVKEDNLVAYITLNSPIETEIIKEKLSKYLTEYMIPNHIEVLKSMPLTPNGKADRKALMREKITIQSIKEYVAPRDEMEKALATIFQELLHIEKVGIYDNFFELGGHSLLATQLVSKIRAELGVELSLKSIFGLSTLEELARTLHQREKVESKIRIKSSKEEYIELFDDSQDDEIEEFIL